MRSRSGWEAGDEKKHNRVARVVAAKRRCWRRLGGVWGKVVGERPGMKTESKERPLAEWKLMSCGSGEEKSWGGNDLNA